MNTSFQYLFAVPAAGDDTRDSVLLDIDFQPVLDANPGKNAFLEYVTLSGVRQNTLGTVEIIESMAARLIGDFEANNLPGATINTPRPGDRIGRFEGLAFSNKFALDQMNELPRMPATFQLEFNPSNLSGKAVGDQVLVSFTIGFRVL